ncbi:MAG: PAS domain S-box protein [Gemmatimonadota bacterium]|nr:PAS domain S-box protein [Gemmatimonadota bacterium]
MNATDPEATTDLERYRISAIIASSEDAIVSKDLDGTIRSWNPAAERIFGYTAEEIVGRPIFTLIPPELHDEERWLLARIAQGEHVSHYEADRVRKDGRRIRISLSLSPVLTPDGRLIGASAIKRDITAQRALENQLQQAQRLEAMGRLAGGIAHDFNNLLTVIGGMAALVLKRHQSDTRDRRDLEQIAQAAERATALTQQLLAFSRQRVSEPEVLLTNDVVSGLAPILRRLVGEHIEFRTVLAPDLGRVTVDRAQLEQVLVNLVVNARDAMPDGGVLTIETANVEISGSFAQEQLRLERGSYVMMAVSDTGAGMDAVTQASIFEPFFTTKPAGEGTGLGLATVYGIVQQAGGGVYVYSEPGHGAVFKVYFPRAAEPADAAQRGSGAWTAGGGTAQGTVLVAEDEPGVRAFTEQVLSEAGYYVLTAASGEEALRVAADHAGPIDLLLTDVVMSGINGRVLSERLAETRPSVPVMYMSGYTDDMVVRTGVVTAGASFLQKPFTPQALLNRVGAAIAPGRSQQG